MKSLLLLRHASYDRSDPRLDDHERPLDQRGRCDALRVGRLVRDEGLVPDSIVSSTAVRAGGTAELVARESGFRGKVEFSRALYLAPYEAYIETLQQLPSAIERVLLIGHNPGLERLLQALTGDGAGLAPSALAHVALDVAQWTSLDCKTRGELVRLWGPVELPAESQSQADS